MRVAHCMIRVGDLDRSLAFYTGPLGMTLHRREEYPQGRFTLAFVGYGPAETGCAIELTHNWDTDSYTRGTGFGHLALETDDVWARCERLAAAGATILRLPGPMAHASPQRRTPEVIAFVADPDGYAIELVETGRGARTGEAPMS